MASLMHWWTVSSGGLGRASARRHSGSPMSPWRDGHRHTGRWDQGEEGLRYDCGGGVGCYCHIVFLIISLLFGHERGMRKRSRWGIKGRRMRACVCVCVCACVSVRVCVWVEGFMGMNRALLSDWCSGWCWTVEHTVAYGAYVSSYTRFYQRYACGSWVLWLTNGWPKGMCRYDVTPCIMTVWI